MWKKQPPLRGRPIGRKDRTTFFREIELFMTQTAMYGGSGADAIREATEIYGEQTMLAYRKSRQIT